MKFESDNNNKKGLQKTDSTNLNEISRALTPLVNYPLINKSIIQNVIKSNPGGQSQYRRPPQFESGTEIVKFSRGTVMQTG